MLKFTSVTAGAAVVRSGRRRAARFILKVIISALLPPLSGCLTLGDAADAKTATTVCVLNIGVCDADEDKAIVSEDGSIDINDESVDSGGLRNDIEPGLHRCESGGGDSECAD